MSDVEKGLTKNQKNKLRKQQRRAKQTPLISPCPPPYRGSTVVAGGRRHSPVLGATRTLEALHASSWLRDPGLTEDALFQHLLSKLLQVDVGSSIPGAEDTLNRSQEFKVQGLRFLKKLRQLDLRAMLDHHCPRSEKALPSPASQVLSLLQAVLHRAGLQDLLALPQTSTARALARLLALTKGGHLTLEELLHVLPAPRALLPWLHGCPKPMKVHLGARLATWALVILPRTLLSALFTITDASHTKRQLHFYRQSVWQAMAARCLHSLLKRGLAKVAPSVFLQPREPSKPHRPPPPAIRPMRFIPKANLAKVRPISMRRALAGEADHDPGLVRDSPLRELVRRLRSLKPAVCDLKGKRLAREWGRLQTKAPPGVPLFWATADITDAFGSVLHRKLTKILTDSAKLLVCYPNAKLLANQVCYRVVRHIVSFRIGRKTRHYHLAGRGLVQGDPLSPDLSSLYYGDFTATHLRSFLAPPKGHHELLLRAADDFLFISTSRERVWQFQRATIGSTFPDYEVSFAPAKFCSNVETGDQSRPAVFCGAVLHMDTRAVAPQHSPDPVVLAAMRPKAPGTKARPAIATKFVSLCAVHLTVLYFGPHNPVATMLTSLACALATALRRLTALLTCLVWAQGRRVEEGWLWRQVLMPGLAKVTRLLRRSGLDRQEVRLVALLCLQGALAACPHYSAQLRKGVASTVARARARVGEARSRAVTMTVLESRRLRSI